ncbi:MAG TPA: hypothetical protein VKK79_01515 [Candidatus Lokiarchaeia archaeon]|nr:hypothetical protein [Candidatus Lokiarchaeia archaeon]
MHSVNARNVILFAILLGFAGITLITNLVVLKTYTIISLGTEAQQTQIEGTITIPGEYTLIIEADRPQNWSNQVNVSATVTIDGVSSEFCNITQFDNNSGGTFYNGTAYLDPGTVVRVSIDNQYGNPVQISLLRGPNYRWIGYFTSEPKFLSAISGFLILAVVWLSVGLLLLTIAYKARTKTPEPPQGNLPFPGPVKGFYALSFAGLTLVLVTILNYETGLLTSLLYAGIVYFATLILIGLIWLTGFLLAKIRANPVKRGEFASILGSISVLSVLSAFWTYDIPPSTFYDGLTAAQVVPFVVSRYAIWLSTAYLLVLVVYLYVKVKRMKPAPPQPESEQIN